MVVVAFGAVVVVLLGAVVVVAFAGLVVVVVAVVVVLLGAVGLVVTPGTVVFVVFLGAVVVVEFCEGSSVVDELAGDVLWLGPDVTVTASPGIPGAPDEVGDGEVGLADHVVVVDDVPGEPPTPAGDDPGAPLDDAGTALPVELPDTDVVRSEATATVVAVGG